MTPRIAVVGIGCRYPDANSPTELWHNVLAGRRAFRRLPDERMNHADYHSPDPQAPDRFYSTKAAVLRDYEFDRVSFTVAGSTYRATDLTHWLALDVTASALADAGFPGGDGLPRQATGVVVGNSLTGEFSRANMMRLRWPYVRRTVAASLAEVGWSEEEAGAFLAALEQRYKAPFPPIDEDSLAGGLSNTIAGRICNHFDLRGGGYTVDGACSSSLLAVATAARALLDGDVDVALAGGVDLSIDPFEVIGFAKTGALAATDMRVYDRHSAGFWPGEGSGMLVLMRQRDAEERGLRSYATITGWGVSSDGKGGITRPEAGGHRLALHRAYQRAGYGVETVGYFEGHGTGTAVGDATELEAIGGALRAAGAPAPVPISSIKGNIGHTKAAAGVAGLIKAVLAVHHQVIPPASGHVEPHPQLLGDRPPLRVPGQAEPWPADTPIRAGVSAMGFGGINTHIALSQAPGVERRDGLDEATLALVAGGQDCELLLFDAPGVAELRGRIAGVLELVPRLAYAELADLAGALAGELAGNPLRAAVVAASPEEAERRLTGLLSLLDRGVRELFSPAEGTFLGSGTRPPRVGYLFPGQGSGRSETGALRRRFPDVEAVYRAAGVVEAGGADHVATEVAQPRIVAGSLAALRVLGRLGLTAEVATGHSLGELTALHWGGWLDETGVLQLARARGRIMASASEGGGAMAGIAAAPAAVEPLLTGTGVVIAGYNGPTQTVVSGAEAAVAQVCAAAAAAGLGATRIRVSHAFHSPLVEPAALAMADHLAGVDFAAARRPVVSTVTGEVLPESTDPRQLLVQQVRLPVRFTEAAARVAAGTDLIVEVGPGRVLTGLTAEIAPAARVLPVEADSPSLAGLLRVVGAAFALGTPVRVAELFGDRLLRPLPADGQLRFLASPCEAAPQTSVGLPEAAGPSPALPAPSRVASPAPVSDPVAALAPALAGAPRPVAAVAAATTPAPPAATGSAATSRPGTLELLRRLASERAELPLAAVQPGTNPLDDLHLSSITVGQIVNQVARELGRPALAATTNYATATLADLARMLDELNGTALPAEPKPAAALGVAPWVRAFAVEYRPRPAPAVTGGAGVAGSWVGFHPPGHPLAEPLRLALQRAGIGNGVLLCLEPDCGDGATAASGGPAQFLAAARAVLQAPAGTRLVVVQRGFGASGLAKTLHLEAPQVPTCVVELADLGQLHEATAIEQAVRRVVTEAATTTGFREVRYDATGARLVPELRLVEPAPVAPSAEEVPGTEDVLGAEDVLLVTGGGKGITAECALSLAATSGATLLLLGRSDPATDPELAANLDRFTAAGVRHHYLRVDVAVAAQIRAALDALPGVGAVTAVLHGAGRNEPAALTALTEEEFRATLAPKVDGLRAVLDAVDPRRLRLLVTFGSIIGRAGLRGEAHYATANDWLTEQTRRFQAEHPRCRCLALEWSVWSGAGMGERLGVVESLIREGITPIATDDGIAILHQLLADPETPTAVVVAGRAQGLPTLPLPRRELPLRRFLERVLVDYPGIELVSEVELSAGSDPYLGDHLLDGDLLFPAVLGMEAMAQVAAAASGHTTIPSLSQARFLRPIVVPVAGSTTIQVAALVTGAATVQVAIRSGETGFAADHFRATLHFPRPHAPRPQLPDHPDGAAGVAERALPLVPVDPTAELYGGVLFQGKRFQRLLAYRRAAARHAVAEIATGAATPWFAPYQPQELLLADPGTRDAMMHALQCCVPDATLLPESVDQLDLAHPTPGGEEGWVVLDARERLQDGDSYLYDLLVWDPVTGALVERWQGLRLRAVRRRHGRGPWVPSLLGPYLERAVEELLGGSRAVVVEPDPVDGAEAATGGVAARRDRTALAVSRATGAPTAPRYRPDGRPELPGATMSASHGAGATMVVVGAGRLGCDLQAVARRDAQEWDQLLGAQLLALRDLLGEQTGEELAVASTRVWGAVECLRKTAALTQALTVETVRPDGWVLLRSGHSRIASWVTTLNGQDEPAVVTVLTGSEE